MIAVSRLVRKSPDALTSAHCDFVRGCVRDESQDGYRAQERSQHARTHPSSTGGRWLLLLQLRVGRRIPFPPTGAKQTCVCRCM